MIETPAQPAPHRGTRAATWALRLSVAASCIGYGIYQLRFGSPIGEYLFNERDWSEEAMLTLENVSAAAFIGAGLLTLWVVWWPVLVALSLWLLVWTLCTWRLGGQFGSELTPMADATRYLAPLALGVLAAAAQSSSGARVRAAEWLLRIMLAATFVGHGLEALRLHPIFLDYLIGAASHLLDWRMSQQAAEVTLRLIGVTDLALAVAIVSRRWRTIAGYMALWAAITALSRIVHNGWPAYPHTLIRAAHVGAALALWFYWSAQQRAASLPPDAVPSEHTHAQQPPLASSPAS